MVRYWIIVASKNHVMHGVSLGIVQANHGKRSGISRMHKGDGIVCYSPKASYEGHEPLKSFTALGFITDEEIYQIEESPDFRPFRRRARYVATKDVEAAPLVDKLKFIRNKKAWGYVMRFGLIEIPKEDFDLIARKMGAPAGDSGRVPVRKAG
ncbi:MAG TPA: EVE domain-containing protein [Methanoregula sp.]|nr:EVE domain-containing protein [Methanoregula sp.]